MTRQVSDILIYEGRKYPLLSPIQLPDDNTIVVKLSNEEFKLLFVDINKEWAELKLNIDSHPSSKEEAYTLTESESDLFNKHFSNPLVMCGSTACWRRYIATWEILDDVLYLKDINGKYKLLSDFPIIADWYSNTLKIGLGKTINSNMILAAGDIYENENHLVVERGIVTHTELFKQNEKHKLLHENAENRTKDRSKLLRKFLDDCGE